MPQFSDLRESGVDIVAFIHRSEYYGIDQDENGMSTAGLAEIIIAKHRNGAVCDVNLRFLKERARFADMDDAIRPSPQATDDEFTNSSKNYNAKWPIKVVLKLANK